MLRFDKAAYLSLQFKFILSVRSSNSLLGSDVFLLEFINKGITLCYTFVELITFFHIV